MLVGFLSAVRGSLTFVHLQRWQHYTLINKILHAKGILILLQNNMVTGNLEFSIKHTVQQHVNLKITTMKTLNNLLAGLLFIAGSQAKADVSGNSLNAVAPANHYEQERPVPPPPPPPPKVKKVKVDVPSPPPPPKIVVKGKQPKQPPKPRKLPPPPKPPKPPKA